MEVTLTPSSRRAAVVCDRAGLRVDVKAPPIEGRANAEGIELIARAFGVPKSRVTLVKGARGRHKVFEVTAAQTLPPGFAPARSGQPR